MVGLHGGTGVMCKALGGTGAMVCYAISEGDVALAVGGCWAMGMGMRMPCHRWGYYCMWYGRLASFMCGIGTVGEGRGEKGVRAVGTRLLCRDADRRSRGVRWT